MDIEDDEVDLLDLLGRDPWSGDNCYDIEVNCWTRDGQLTIEGLDLRLESRRKREENPPGSPLAAAVALAASNGLFLLNRNALLLDDGEDDITVCCILVSFLVFLTVEDYSGPRPMGK